MKSRLSKSDLTFLFNITTRMVNKFFRRRIVHTQHRKYGSSLSILPHESWHCSTTIRCATYKKLKSFQMIFFRVESNATGALETGNCHTEHGNDKACQTLSERVKPTLDNRRGRKFIDHTRATGVDKQPDNIQRVTLRFHHTCTPDLIKRHRDTSFEPFAIFARVNFI
jgi:hypothetical protein